MFGASDSGMASRRVRQAGSVEPYQPSNGFACSLSGVVCRFACTLSGAVTSLEPLPRFMVVMILVGIGEVFSGRLRRPVRIRRYGSVR